VVDVIVENPRMFEPTNQDGRLDADEVVLACEFACDANAESEGEYVVELLGWASSAPMTGQRGQLLW
jgi:hypothetical protein